MKAVKQIDIYLTKKRPVKVIDVVQYNTGIQLVFTVKDFSIPTGATAKLYVQKPSGKFVYQEENITVSGNTITIDLENQAIAEHGKVPYQVELKNGSDDISTFTGLMMVEASLKDAGAVESKTVIKAFDNVVQDRLTEFQTMAEQVASAVIATIPEDYTVMEAKVNELANAIKGHLSGIVVFADDVSPVEHEMSVLVRGKNLLPSGTITFTKNKQYTFNNPLPAGTYTISASITSNDTDGTLSAVSINNGSEVLKYIPLKRNERASSTFTVKKPITTVDFCAAYNYSQGEGDSATWSDIQIEEGEVATDYTPYIDPSTVMVRRCGKNLIGLGSVLNETNSSSVVAGEKLTITGYFSSIITTNLKSGKRYTISFDSTRTGSAGGGISIEFFDESGTRIHGIYKQNELSATVSFTVPENTKRTRFYFYGSGSSANTTDSATYRNIQVEIGDVATDFEAYKGTTEYIPSSDGTVEGITSLSPNMTILTDTENVIVECEYNKDTSKVIQKICDALGIEV